MKLVKRTPKPLPAETEAPPRVETVSRFGKQYLPATELSSHQIGLISKIDEYCRIQEAAEAIEKDKQILLAELRSTFWSASGPHSKFEDLPELACFQHPKTEELYLVAHRDVLSKTTGEMERYWFWRLRPTGVGQEKEKLRVPPAPTSQPRLRKNRAG